MSDDEKYKHIFLYHARTPNGVPVIDLNGFLDAVVPRTSAGLAARIATGTYKLLFRAADRDGKGYLNLDDWMRFVRTLRLPDAEFRLAFDVFDTSKTGRVSLRDFQNVYFRHKSPQSLPFDFTSQFARLYFGRGGAVPYAIFCQMLNSFSFERVNQMYAHFDPRATGFISVNDFQTILNAVGKYKLSDRFLQKAGAIVDHASSQSGMVSYSTVNAFFNIIRRAELVREIAQKCANSEGYFSRDAFTQQAAATLDWQLPSPLEIDLLFFFAGVTVSGTVGSLDAFNGLFDPMWEAKKQLYIKRRGKFVDEVQNSAKSFALGCVAGAIGATAVYPIDLVKTRMQRQRKSSAHPTLYKNSWQCFSTLVRKEGPLALYSGLKPQLVGVAPEKAIKLAVNDFVREFFRADNGKVPRPAEVLAGATAGAFQVIFTNPVEIIKIRLQVQGDTTYQPAAGGPKTALKIIQELGLSGLYRGCHACLLRDVSFSSIYFPVYYRLKVDYFGESPFYHTKIGENLVAGATAAVPAAFLTTPCDVIKTRLQVEPTAGELPYRGLMDAAVKIYREEGLTAFFKGGPARVLRSAPQFGITLATYEFLKRLVPTNETKSRMFGSKQLPEALTNNGLRLLLNIDENFGAGAQ